MAKNIYSLPISFEVIDEIKTNDNRFLKVIIDVLHTGLNFNGSVFEKEVVNENIETIKNTPILGFIRKLPCDEKDFKGHEYVLTKIENGVERKYIGSAYGVIPESCNPRWVTKLCSDNEEREFLRVDGLLWTKFKDSVEIMNRDIEKGHSMELFPDVVEGYEDEDTGIFHFTKFSFDGCCILGDDCQPAMINSNITINEVQFAISDFVKEIQSELNNKYTAFTQFMNENKDIDKDIDDVNNTSKPQDNNTKGGNGDMATDFSQTVMQQFSDIDQIVGNHELIKDRWGDAVSRYHLVDIQENEVIIIDAKNNYQYYGCEFSVEGDKPVVKFETAKRKKVTYADYVEGESSIEGAFDFGEYITKIEDTAFAKVSEAEDNVKKADEKTAQANEDKATAETNYSELKAQYDDIKPKYDEYVKANNARIEAENKEKKDNLIAQYETHLKDNEEFVELKTKLNDYSIDEIETKCAVMYARKNVATNFNANKKGATVLGVSTNDDEHEGCVYTKKYGWIRTN